MTIYLDIDPAIGLARARARGELDRIEREQLDFFVRTRARYRELAAQDPRIETVDAAQAPEAVARAIQAILERRLCIRG